MGKVLKRLQLHFFLISWIIYGGVEAAPYSKYGRTCRDIGCLPREVCTMAYDTCSFNQQEGTNCGRYPTCVKSDKTQQPAPQQNTGPSNPSPLPPSTSSPSIWNLPTAPTTTTTRRPTTTTTTTRRAWTTKSPFYNPANPSYEGGGNYFGNRYGDDSIFGGGPTTRSTTKRPSSSSGSSIDSFFSGFSNFLSGDTGKLIQGILAGGGSSKPSSTGSSGGFGSFFGSGGSGNTRPLIENKNRGGLFSENRNQNEQASASNNDYNRYPVTRQGQAPSPPAPNASHGNYGWKLS